MSIMISEKEQRLLSLLRAQSGPVSLETTANELGISEETARSLLDSLVQKKLVTRQVETRHFYEFSSEAQQYARDGLPEVQLVRLLGRRKGGALLSELEADPSLPRERAKLALGWAKRNGWVTLGKKDGKPWVALTQAAQNAEKHPVQAALHKAANRNQLEESELGANSSTRQAVHTDLLRRNLASLVSRDQITATITRTGLQVLQEIRPRKEQIGELTPDLLRSGAWRDRPFRTYNLLGPVPNLYLGKKHPYMEFVDRVARSLIGLGFQEAKGPLVELEFWNCDALFMPQDHVAREVHDIYHIKIPKGPGRIAYPLLLQQVGRTHEDGWTTKSTGWNYKFSPDVTRQLVLRSQTTAVSMRYLAEHNKAPLRMFCIDRNFRPEKFDATHSAEFLQCEGIIGGEGLTLRDLLGYLRAISEGVGIEKIRFKPGYFPFTEPSVEGFIYIPGIGWREALPGGIFRPEVTQPLGIDFPVLAWGIGIDRLAMAALDIHDIRELCTHNLAQLRNASLRV
jgi:phenylalanyl-tRNA synthetase alpha chain